MGTIIERSRQRWKLAASFISVALGTTLIVRGHDSGFGITLPLLGVVLCATGFLFGVLAIRCPLCGARWVWLAVSEQPASRWFQWLDSQTACPACQHDPAAR